MPPKMAGICLIVAAALFWITWLLMPGVGVTDAREIFTLVAQQRPNVRLSAILQLVSAACYAPALVGVVVLPWKRSQSTVLVGATLLLIGAIGSAADAIFHLIAYEMTAPDAPEAPLLPIMARLQGPDLAFIAPLLACFFLGSIVLAIGFARAGQTTTWNPALYVVALVVVVIGSRLLTADPNGQRIVERIVLGLLSVSQAWLGLGLWKPSAVARTGSW